MNANKEPRNDREAFKALKDSVAPKQPIDTAIRGGMICAGKKRKPVIGR